MNLSGNERLVRPMSPLARLKLIVPFAVGAPAVFGRLSGFHLAPLWALVVYGGAVVASAFLLSWAAEAFQLDVSASLATAALALIAVLPEYAVDLYFAYSAGHDPDQARYAAANMTGSNRLLLGFGWPLVTALALFAARRNGQASDAVRLGSACRVELAFLAIASVYSFVIILTARLVWYDAVVMLALFGFYLAAVSRQARGTPHLIGMAAEIGSLAAPRRRALVAGLFIWSAAVVVVSAEPFAKALVASGRELGINEFLLVQWLAPLASESPELLVASMLALRGNQDAAFGTVLSSKVNQWTLLVGSLPVAYYVGGGHGGLPLDSRQVEEVTLTAAQTILGFAVLCNLEVRRWEAAALFLLFIVQFALPEENSRRLLCAIYLFLSGVILFRHRRYLPAIAGALRQAA